MAVFSKPLSINYTCYELGHCWTPYCRKASTDIAGHVFKEALKIYGTLYLVAGLFKRRGLDYYIKKLIPETLRSSIFLTINGTLFITMFCVWRHLVGFYLFYNVFFCGVPACILSISIEQKCRTMLGCMFLLTTSFIPAYIAAFTAVMVERKSRRGPLAVYLTNLAIETGYRMLVERNLVRPVANGEVYLFSAVSAVYLYLFRTQNGLSSSTESLFRFFVGGDENPKRSLTPRSLTDSFDHTKNATVAKQRDVTAARAPLEWQQG
ncbi:transmembrane protein 135-like isoform X1 [Physella acuta]|uniref:transmembrane protein 135-like isoform X1 n=1 Tax=Physella acuta TaxID=109671 RepID=UPI0027DC1DB8|nr:transmembrane protein 135-like isoform X1 [Physella acuta]